jgi:YgiT-type zinc finger domain-containing protein
MNKKESKNRCAVCGGNLIQGEATCTVDFGSGIVVVRNVPATVCSQCGMEWIGDNEAEKIESIVKEAKANHKEVEIMSLSV